MTRRLSSAAASSASTASSAASTASSAAASSAVAASTGSADAAPAASTGCAAPAAVRTRRRLSRGAEPVVILLLTAAATKDAATPVLILRDDVADVHRRDKRRVQVLLAMWYREGTSGDEASVIDIRDELGRKYPKRNLKAKPSSLDEFGRPCVPHFYLDVLHARVDSSFERRRH